MLLLFSISTPTPTATATPRITARITARTAAAAVFAAGAARSASAAAGAASAAASLIGGRLCDRHPAGCGKNCSGDKSEIFTDHASSPLGMLRSIILAASVPPHAA